LTFVYILGGGISTCDAPLYFIMSNDQGINGKIYHSSLLVACLYFLWKCVGECKKLVITLRTVRNEML